MGPEKLRLDLPQSAALCRPTGSTARIDEDTRELIVRLATRAGMIMEDASLLAITMPADNEVAIIRALDQLSREVETVLRLIGAAAALVHSTARTSSVSP